MRTGNLILLEDISEADDYHKHRDVLCGQLYVVFFAGSDVVTLQPLFTDVCGVTVSGGDKLSLYREATTYTLVKEGVL